LFPLLLLLLSLCSFDRCFFQLIGDSVHDEIVRCSGSWCLRNCSNRGLRRGLSCLLYSGYGLLVDCVYITTSRAGANPIQRYCHSRVVRLSGCLAEVIVDAFDSQNNETGANGETNRFSAVAIPVNVC
jgi:hypothetical protein